MSPYYQKFVFLFGFLSFIEGQTNSRLNRILQDNLDVLESKDTAASAIIQSLIQEMKDFKENVLGQQKMVKSSLTRILEAQSEQLTNQDITISSLKRNVAELTRKNEGSSDESLTLMKLEISEMKATAKQRDQMLANMVETIKRQSEETERMKEEMIELETELNYLKQCNTKECDKIGTGVQDDDHSTNSSADDNNFYHRNMTRPNSKQTTLIPGGKYMANERKLKTEEKLGKGNRDIPGDSHFSSRNVGQLVTVPNVAFHAIVSGSGIQHLGQDQIIVFETVHLNLDGGYNKINGIFTAPKGGLYLFSVSILSSVDPKSKFDVGLVKNGGWLAAVYGHGNSGQEDQGSVTVAMKLDIGDQVWARSSHITDNSIGGYGFTSFTGVLIA